MLLKRKGKKREGARGEHSEGREGYTTRPQRMNKGSALQLRSNGGGRGEALLMRVKREVAEEHMPEKQTYCERRKKDEDWRASQNEVRGSLHLRTFR